MTNQTPNTDINKELVEFAYANLQNLPRGEQYERMILGAPFDCFNRELWLARNLAHEVALDYANIRMKDHDFNFRRHQEARVAHLRQIFGSIELDIVVEPPFFVDYGCNIKIGKLFYCNFNATFLDCTLITIGDNVMMGPNCCITTITHPTDPTERATGKEFAFPVKIGDNVWLGSNVNVMPGVTIGDGAVVGAGAVVTKDVPANCVVVGVPARIVKRMKGLEERAMALKLASHTTRFND